MKKKKFQMGEAPADEEKMLKLLNNI